MEDSTANVRVVGIGASAGGIEALKEFFGETPADTGLAFVVIQHLSPNQPSQMAALLSKFTEMEVAPAEEGARVHANHVYTIPPGKFISIKEGRLHLAEPVPSDGLRMPIDFFFRSLAEDQRENAIAVLFSGSGSDGTLGIREIHGVAGCVMVQDPNTAQFDSMIEHALATGMVDCVLPVREIPAALLRYVRHIGGTASHPSDAVTMRDGVASILNLLASQSQGDYRCYKPATISRRIQRRMALNQLDIDNISEYYRYLQECPDELGKLSKDMLIGVTSFFRDPEAFEELGDKVIAPLVQKKYSGDPLRAWVAGCATGEEVYSIVILFMEEMTRARKSFKLQIFASDIDSEALKRAREGVYSESIAADVSEERLGRFFKHQNGTYQVDDRVREAVAFAAHNVILDPPFFNMDLISCRNLLIYIEPQMQKTILSRFAFALKPDSYLFLGKSENPLEQNDIFQPISKSMRLFRRTPFLAAPIANFALRSGAPLAVPTASPERLHTIRLSDLNQQVLLQHFQASIVLIEENGQIRHFYGPTHRYLSHSSGDANLSLFEMVENRHSPMLRVGVERAARQKESVRLEALEFGSGDAAGSINVTIRPVVDSEAGVPLFAVIFEDTGMPGISESAGVPHAEPHNNTLVARLEAENRVLRADLQASSDGFQAAHEKLTVANEEVMAINEELQATNEELVSSKEELQSLNEELSTTNSQLNDKVEELGLVNDDLANFLNASEVATIFLDRKFCIRRFTPSATNRMNLLPLDLGRPISDLSNKFIDTDLIAIADGVLKTLIPVEKEVVSTDGLWHMLRCLPYRSLKDAIEGVVFTFTDVTSLKHSEVAMMQARDYAENIIHTTREALLVLDPELRVISANRAFYETFRAAPEETLNRRIYELGNGQWDIPNLRELLEQLLQTNSMVEDFEVMHGFPDIGPKFMSLNAKRIYNRGRKDVQLILLAISDLTEAEARARLAAVVESSDDAIIGKNLDGIVTSWNAGAERLFGYRADEMIGQSILRIIPPGREEEEEKQILLRLWRGERMKDFETVRVRRDKQLINVSLTISPIKDSRGNIVGASKIARDITERKRLEQQRQELSRELEKQVFERTAELRQANRTLLQDIEERQKLEEQLRQTQKLESLGVLAAGVAHDLNNLLNIIQGYASVLGPGATPDDIGESVAAITETTQRGAMLVQQLLALARKTEIKMEPLDPSILIQGLSNLIKRTFPKNIEMTLDLASGSPSMMGDRNQLTQTLLNLCVNARDAMPDGGALTIKTSVVDGKELESYGDVNAEEFVSIEITDTGTGMDEIVQSKMFEPFFTTKETGRGTGLGLAVAYGILKSHNGVVQVKSRPMQGTTFWLYFPALSSGG